MCLLLLLVVDTRLTSVYIKGNESSLGYFRYPFFVRKVSMDPRTTWSQLIQHWHNAREQIVMEELPEDTIGHWWPTLIEQEPNYNVIVMNMMSLLANPFMAFLSTYFYGYSQALDDIENERVVPFSRDDVGRNRLPDWLEGLQLEKLAEEFGDKH